MRTYVYLRIYIFQNRYFKYDSQLIADRIVGFDVTSRRRVQSSRSVAKGTASILASPSMTTVSNLPFKDNFHPTSFNFGLDWDGME